jgi:hypothetical protein
MGILKFKLNRRQRRKIKKSVLENIDIDIISLVARPANGAAIVVKDENGRQVSERGTAVITKVEKSATEGRIYATVYQPDVKDKQGDSATAEEIQKACENFSKKGRMQSVDVNHNLQKADGFYIAQNYILQTADPAHFPGVKKGSWVVVIKCDDLNSDTWKAVEKKEITGVSMYGEADHIDVNKGNEDVINALKDLSEKISKAAGDNPDEGTKKSLAEIQNQIKDLEGKDQDDHLQKSVDGIIKSFEKLAEKLNVVISKSVTGEPGAGKMEDEEITINGEKIVIKAERKELHKAIGDVDSGIGVNILTDNLGAQFIDSVIDSMAGDTFSDITMTQLAEDEKVDKGLISDIVLKNEDDGAASAADISSGSITCATETMFAEITLGQNIVEFYRQKLGDAAFGAYVENKITTKINKAIRGLMYKGNKAGAAGVKGMDGIITIATAAADVTAVDTDTYELYTERLDYMLGTLSSDMLDNKESLVIYVSHYDELMIRREIAKRPTTEGDRLLLSGGKITYDGIAVKPRLMTSGYVIIAIAKYIILGFRSDATLKLEHHGSDFKYHWYIRVRAGMAYIAGDGVNVFLCS